MDRYIVVLAGAGLGGLMRYTLGTWIMAKYGGRFPLGTFLINVMGSFLIGVLMTVLTERIQPHPNWRLFLVVGVLGGFTTFSSFEYETYQAVRNGGYCTWRAVYWPATWPCGPERSSRRGGSEGESVMLGKGPAKKVTIFINETAQYHMQSLHDAILTYLMHRGVSGATATRAFAGFGSHQQLHTPKIEVLSMDLPIRIEFVETAEKVGEVLPTLYEMVSDGLIEVQDTTVVRHARKSPRPETKAPHERQQGPAKLLRVYMGEADKWHGEPLYDAIVKKLRMLEIAGATVYRGVLGYGAKGHEHKRSFFHPTRDLPVMVTVIDSPEKIAAAAEVIEEMLEDGLIVTSDVDIVRLVRSHKVTEVSDEPRVSS